MALENMFNKSRQSYHPNCTIDTDPYQLQTMDDFTCKKTEGEWLSPKQQKNELKQNIM